MKTNLRNLADSQRRNHGILVAGHYNQEYGYNVNRSKGDTAWLITLTLEGRGLFRIDNTIRYCEARDITIIPPGTPQHYSTVEGNTWDFLWCHFLPPAHWDAMLRIFEPNQKNKLFHIHLYQQELFQETYKAFDRIYKYRQSNITLSLNGLEEVLIRVSDYGSDSEQGLDHRIKEIMTYLAEHLAKTHSLSSLAARVHLSRSRLSHLFKEQVGESIFEVLLKMRLHQSMRLLEFTSMNISEIAKEVGFRSPFYFTSRFTEYYGMNPSSFKKLKKQR